MANRNKPDRDELGSERNRDMIQDEEERSRQKGTVGNERNRESENIRNRDDESGRSRRTDPSRLPE